uniref:Uncharacterized protein n=1 Tax=Seriola lalandi dorsalis TaxID=1841481 RepID=A0A3B4WNS8_SERLL
STSHPLHIRAPSPDTLLLWVKNRRSVEEIAAAMHCIELNYTKGQKTAWVFDLCTVIKCGSREQAWRGYDMYLCVTVWWHYSPDGWTYTPSETSTRYQDPDGLKSKIDITRTSNGVGNGVNPIMLTADAISRNPFSTCASQENPAEYFVLGVEQSGTDTMGLIKVNFLDPVPTVTTAASTTETKKQTEEVSNEVDMIKLSTGYTDKNMWLDWVTSTAGEPTLTFTPAPLYPDTDPQGFRCMLAMHMTPAPSNCSTLVSLFPVVKNTTVPPVFTPREGNYTCLHRKKTAYIPTPVMMGNVSSDWCSLTVDVTGWANMSTLVWTRADLFWYCGGTKLYNFLPPQWIGTCTMTRLAVPLNMVGRKLKAQKTARIKRSAAEFDWMSSSPTYIDAIGVHRGVPNEFKLADQIAAGFESSLCWWFTTNKNVDRINYVYYNVQRLGNATGDAIAGLSEQLAADSLMTVQNRMALDMLLAEKGGVCHMFGEQCCTVIPNNTANGKWLNLTTSMLVLCGFCCVPCIRSLCVRLITATIEGKASPPPPYQMPLLGVEVDGTDEEDEMVMATGI